MRLDIYWAAWWAKGISGIILRLQLKDVFVSDEESRAIYYEVLYGSDKSDPQQLTTTQL